MTLLLCLFVCCVYLSTTLGAGELQKALESAMAAQGTLMQIYGPLHEHLATCYKWVCTMVAIVTKYASINGRRLEMVLKALELSFVCAYIQTYRHTDV